MGIELNVLGQDRAVATARRRPESATREGEAAVVRFDEHQRLQHALMMSSFIILALTGMPQKFSGLALSQWWVDTLGGLQMVRAIHRSAGLIMLADCVYHLAYLGFRMGVQGRLGPLRMIPSPKDLKDMAQTLLYFVGLTSERPKFDRFSYLEKFDYWAVFWGICMIGGSGLALMFPVVATHLLPGQVLPVALVIHSDEAVLAVGWILIVHMFNVHLAPWVFPFNPAIFTGKLAAERCAEDHPLEWQRIVANGGSGDASAFGARHPVARLAAGARTRANRAAAAVGQRGRACVRGLSVRAAELWTSITSRSDAS